MINRDLWFILQPHLCQEMSYIKKKSVSIRNFQRFATTYTKARRETPKGRFVCFCVFRRRSQFREITKQQLQRLAAGYVKKGNAISGERYSWLLGYSRPKGDDMKTHHNIIVQVPVATPLSRNFPA